MGALISRYFAVEETYTSELAARKGINNKYPDSLKDTIRFTANSLDLVRGLLGKPVLVNSWYRCLELNRLLGSKDTSAHIKGLAVDFICPGFGSPLDIIKELIKNALYIKYDQIIYEHTWVHIAFHPTAPRLDVLTLLPNGTYAKGLVS